MRDLLVIAAGFAVVGAAAGVIWALVSDPPQVTRYVETIGQDELQLAGMFAMDGWYVVVAAIPALLGGLWFGWRRRRDPVATVILVTLGACLAGLVMFLVGQMLGPDDPTVVLADAEVGATATAQLSLSSKIFGLVWPLGATAGLFLVNLLTSSDVPDQNRPEDQ
ncbi:MAG: hypothetical protein HZY75_08675 [Nocardioidaceae bacterium]|nr:MAG: hypothetical protein HZY75_08675 [Nocardioidaceae bacterium]